MSRFHRHQVFRQWILFLCLFASTLALAAESRHVVRPGETLTSIARHHSLSVAELAVYNGLARNAKVKSGQTLRLPGATPEASHGTVSSPITRAIANAPVQPGRWKYVVIHHSGVDAGTVAGMDRYHRQVRHMENGLAYHFVIGNGQGMGDGEIAVGQRWRQQLDGGHLASEDKNQVSIGICLVGNFERQPPSPKQLQSLNGLVDALLARCRLKPGAVKTHQEIHARHTACPGRKFPARNFHKELKTRNG